MSKAEELTQIWSACTRVGGIVSSGARGVQGARNARNTTRSLAKIVLAFVLVLGLLPATGCKPTDVLTEVAYTDDSELLTENTMWQFLSQADPNPDFSSNTSQ